MRYLVTGGCGFVGSNLAAEAQYAKEVKAAEDKVKVVQDQISAKKDEGFEPVVDWIKEKMQAGGVK